MKTTTYSLILAALAATGSAFGADTAYTTPVGYISHTLAAAAPGASADTYISASLTQPVEFAGSSTVSPSGGKVATLAGGVPTSFGTSYVLEITSGPSEGWWSTVTASTATTVTVNDNFPSGLPANVTISVRKHSTLSTFLGTNAPGLVTYDGVNPNDEVQVLDPVGQVVSAYAYVSGPNLSDPLYPNGAWFDLLASSVANDTVIEPGTSIKIKRIGTTPATFSSVGTVKTTKTQVDVFANYNWVGNPLATGGTLNGMTFNTQLVKYDGVSANYDELQYVRASQVVQPYAAVDDGGATMFDLTNSVPAGAEPFAEGTGVIIRRIGNPASVITIPGTVVAQ